jgi:hypothetical protein
MIYGGRFELDKSVDDINKLESIMQEPNFWDDKNKTAYAEEVTISKDFILSQIKELEQKQLRSLREVALGNTESMQYLNDIEEKIVALRNKIE